MWIEVRLWIVRRIDWNFPSKLCWLVESRIRFGRRHWLGCWWIFGIFPERQHISFGANFWLHQSRPVQENDGWRRLLLHEPKQPSSVLSRSNSGHQKFQLQSLGLRQQWSEMGSQIKLLCCQWLWQSKNFMQWIHANELWRMEELIDWDSRKCFNFKQLFFLIFI